MSTSPWGRWGHDKVRVTPWQVCLALGFADRCSCHLYWLQFTFEAALYWSRSVLPVYAPLRVILQPYANGERCFDLASQAAIRPVL